MIIENYSFGSIKINGKKYRKDVIIFPDSVYSPWWRKEGHRLSIEDLKEVIDNSPDRIIIGTGAYGVMKVPGSVKDELEENNIEVIIEKTGKAVELFNKFSSKEEKVIACLHLTC